MNNIDIVYLWCNMSDEAWNERRKEVAKQWPDVPKTKESAISRYQSHDELRYSLRSMEMYAPWIHNVFIVVSDDNALPSWLDTSNPRLRIIRHSEIIPAEYLPCYNSPTIEQFIHFIPDLSEKYLYSNDDMFFFDSVTHDFFFDDNEEPIIRVTDAKFNRHTESYFQKSLTNAYRIILDNNPDIDPNAKKYLQFYPHHCIDSYRKSHNISTFTKYKDNITQAFSCPFRKKTDIHRALYLMEEVVNYGANTLIITNSSRLESLCYSGKSWRDGLDNALRIRPKLLCINAWEENTPDDFAWLTLAMDMLYPTPSSFEKSSQG